jgi:DNA-binding IclR family transcriptional regulator
MAELRILANIASVIDCLVEVSPVSVPEIATSTGAPRTNVQRIVDGLLEADLVQVEEDGRVSLGLRWLHLAESSRRAKREWRGSHDILQSLAAETGQTAYLIVPEGDHVLCVDWSPGRGLGILELRPGGTLPLYAGAAGRVALAFGPVDADTYLEKAPFERLTPHTIVDAEELRADVAKTRVQGFVISDEDVTLGVTSMGVPICHGGRYFGSLSFGGPKGEVLARMEEHLDILRAAADALVAHW